MVTMLADELVTTELEAVELLIMRDCSSVDKSDDGVRAGNSFALSQVDG
jgi:hypothetical protein